MLIAGRFAVLTQCLCVWSVIVKHHAENGYREKNIYLQKWKSANFVWENIPIGQQKTHMGC